MNVYRFIDQMNVEMLVVARTMQSALMLYYDRSGATPVECKKMNHGFCPVIVEQSTDEPIKEKEITAVQFHVFSSPQGEYDAVMDTNVTATPLPVDVPPIDQIDEQPIKQTPNPFYTA